MISGYHCRCICYVHCTHLYGEDEMFFFHAKRLEKNGSLGNWNAAKVNLILRFCPQWSRCPSAHSQHGPSSGDHKLDPKGGVSSDRTMFEMWRLRCHEKGLTGLTGLTCLWGTSTWSWKSHWKAKPTICGLLYYVWWRLCPGESRKHAQWVHHGYITSCSVLWEMMRMPQWFIHPNS